MPEDAASQSSAASVSLSTRCDATKMTCWQRLQAKLLWPQKTQRSILRLNLVQEPCRRQLRNYFVLTALAIPRGIVTHSPAAFQETREKLRPSRDMWRRPRDSVERILQTSSTASTRTWVRCSRSLPCLKSLTESRNKRVAENSMGWKRELPTEAMNISPRSRASPRP